MSAAAQDGERDLLAAEYALGVLEGGELQGARRLALADPDFAAEVAAWQERLAPLVDEIAEAQPDPAVWDRIRQRLDETPAAGANVVPLRRKLNIWRGYAAAVTAIAASLAFIVYQGAGEPPVAVQEERAPVMVAALSSEETGVSLSVAYDPQQASLLVTPGQATPAAGQAHQLWVIPSGGTPVSLGLVREGAPHRLPVPADVARHLQARSTVAVSVEPPGGSPTGLPTGPVVATGELVTV